MVGAGPLRGDGREGVYRMEPIEKVSSVEQAERQIREYILSDEVQIGEKLPTEKQLCQTLSVGRGTVREAIRLLQAKGLVELRPGRGAFIASKSEQDSEDIADWFRKNEIQVKDLIDVRLVIEPLAAKLALKRCDAKDVEHLREILAESEQAAAEADNVKLAVCDEKFHTFIFECTRNKLLIDINRKIERSLITFRNKTFTIPNNVQNFIPAHRAIVNAFEAGSPEMAEFCMKAHMEAVAADYDFSKEVIPEPRVI